MTRCLPSPLFLIALLALALPALANASEPLNLRQRLEPRDEQPLIAAGVAVKTQAALQAFYLERGFELAWHQQGEPTPQALAAVAAIAEAANDGLLPEDYHLGALRNHFSPEPGNSVGPTNEPVDGVKREGGLEQGRDAMHGHPNHLDYDLLLSDAMVNLSQHLLAGKVDPATLSPEWQGQRRQKDVVAWLRGLVETDDVAARINELRPNQVRYFRLRQLLARMLTETSPEWPELGLYPLIKPGAEDGRVNAIRQRLRYWGDLPVTPIDETSPTAPADEAQRNNPNLYDAALLDAVTAFQRRHGLEEDGVIGQQTLQALNISPAQRKQQITNNLERWRWLAEDLGEKHVLVNIAGFELKMVENNQTVAQKPVIVGRDYRRTPVFSDRIRYLVFNPTWTVPYKLAVKDKLPDIRNDPTYLSRMGFTVFDREQQVVDPASVDWNSLSGRGFPFRLVQSPGPLNALGQVKFMFPNVYDVYLHDTPSRELFAKKGRAFSSGCVRVAEPMELAAWLLQANGIGPTEIDAIVAKGETRTIMLKQPVPVHIEYWTAWIDSRGELHFRNDIYHRDPPLAEALATPLYGPGF